MFKEVFEKGIRIVIVDRFSRHGSGNAGRFFGKLFKALQCCVVHGR